jgi:hypothetical protein
MTLMKGMRDDVRRMRERINWNYGKMTIFIVDKKFKITIINYY